MPLQLRVADVPIDRLAPRGGRLRESALLESGPGFGDSGRWSVYAADPVGLFEATDDRWRLRLGDAREEGRGEVLQALGGLLERFRLADPSESPEAGLPPFTGGLIGFFGYD